ncbi:MAG: hypothetical protein HY926_05480 [Elusimicrobia bacterium]|nr:hypothetical protein [Elusimicrobiota bacterium]
MTAAWLLVLGAVSAATGGDTLKGLDLALYHGQGMRDSMRFLMDYYRDEAPYLVRPDVDNAARFLLAADAAVSRPFGSAKNLESVEEAARAGADLVAVLDAQAGFKRDLRLEKRARVALRAEFRDLSGKRLVALEAENVQAPLVDARVRVRRDLYREFAAALDAAAADLESRVRASPELALFAAVRSSGAAAGPGTAARALSSEVDNASFRLPVEPTAVAWVAGVERYEDGGLAPHAERDALAVRNQLIGLGWPDRNVLWFSGRRAERAQLRQGLEAFRRRGAAAAKTFLYFAGRAVTDPGTGRTSLLAWDGGRIPLDDVLDAAPGAGAAVAVFEAPAALGPARPGASMKGRATGPSPWNCSGP